MRRIHASTNTSLLTKCPIFRHGSSLIRATVHKDNLYKTELKKQYGYSLDWLMLNDLYRQGCIFTKTDNIIEIYQKKVFQTTNIKTYGIITKLHHAILLLLTNWFSL